MLNHNAPELEPNFPVCWVQKKLQCLLFEIAHVLAQVYRFATRAHWNLYVTIVEKPMNRWERRNRQVTRKAWRTKLAELERACLQDYKAEISAILDRWGIEAPRRSPRQGDNGPQRRS